MATTQLNTVIRHLRRAVLLRDGATLTDEQLLESFVTQKDQAAFEALVRRHGPMVLGVCRRILRNHHDAEDAFQATFLVLVRKAAGVVPRKMVGNWLYGVAQTTALRAKVAAAKRAVRERQVMALPEPEAVQPEPLWHELQPLLDQELGRLPAKYRVPIILCDLENKSTKEAARNLGWPQGTLAGRLARGRTMLAKRLTRHGLMLSGGALAAALSQNAAAGSAPPSLVVSTIKAANLFAAGKPTVGLISAKAAVLTEGVLKTMFLTKSKIIAAVLFLAGVGGLFSGTGVYRTLAAGPSEAQKPVVESRRKQENEAANNHDKKASPPLTGNVIINAQAGLTGSIVVNERNFDVAQADVVKKEATPTKVPPPIVERRFKQYHVECTLAKIDPKGKDLGKDGKGKLLSNPELLIPEGKESKYSLGGDAAVEARTDNAVEFVAFGLSVRMTIFGLKGGRVRLETVLENTDLERGEAKDVQLRGQIVRSIVGLKLGESVKLVLKDDRGQPRHWVRIKVAKEESVISRTRSAEAPKETPQEKAGEVRLIDEVYPVADLVGNDATALIQVITSTVKPASWDTMGGDGSIDYFPLGMSLVVRQSSDIHERVQALLEALRKVKAEQEKSKK